MNGYSKITENLFSGVYPYPPYKEDSMGKLASFLAGIITGAVTLGVAACFMDKHDKSSSCEDTQTDQTAQAKDKEKSFCELPPCEQ